MKVKVIKKFKDKYTEDIYKAGEILDISNERFNEILKSGLFVEEYQQETENNDIKEETENNDIKEETENNGVKITDIKKNNKRNK